MYGPLQLTGKYLRYYMTASNGKGHGIHSPFVFDFIRQVLLDKTVYQDYASIEAHRKKLLLDERQVIINDLGAGSTTIRTRERKIKDIARTSLKSPKYAQLLYRVVKRYRPGTILELGTSLGITSAYLAKADPEAKLITAEGSSAIAGIARSTFSALALKNAELVEGDFATTLPGILEKNHCIGLAFIDGNHRKEPTLEYFRQILPHCDSNSILVFDDIHWSAGMEAAWSQIRSHPRVTLTIDLFFMSFVFFNADINHPQHFVIRF